MSSARILAPVSLLFAAALFLGTLPFTDMFFFALLHAFAEAGMIGGLADWFAVVALFRHPFGIPIPHTAIIPKHRAKLSKGIIDVVQNKWLDKETIRERVQTLSFAEIFLRWAEDASNRRLAVRMIRSVLKETVRDFDEEKFSERTLSLLRERIHTDDVLRWLKRGLEAIIRKGWHDVLLNALARNIADWLATPRVQTLLAKNLETIAEKYSTTMLRSIGKWIAETTNALNYEDLARSIAMSLKEDIQAMIALQDHPLRKEIETALGMYVRDLERNESLRAFIDEQRERWFDPSQRDMLSSFIIRAKNLFAGSMENDDSILVVQLESFLLEQLQRFRGNVPAQHRLDEWLRERLVRLVEERHSEIGLLVQRNLEKLDDKQLVKQIEEKVGADLQYIRVNGAVVGGLVGTVIFLLKHFLS